MVYRLRHLHAIVTFNDCVNCILSARNFSSLKHHDLEDETLVSQKKKPFNNDDNQLEMSLIQCIKPQKG